MSTGFKVVIPARYGSTRLPGKPLLDIAGKPMIVHVCERALAAEAEQVVVATDDRRIFDAVDKLGLQAVMTDPNHQSGTERIAEVASIMGWADQQIVVNLQGDEPLIPPAYIRDAAQALAGQNRAGIATLAAKIADAAEIFNPNAVKVVLDKDGYALYFSRAPIPWNRATFPDKHDIAAGDLPHLRHIGMYAYTVGFLKSYCDWPASPLESVESLEQLRILWHGEKVLVKIVDKTPEAGVDTEEDLVRVSNFLYSS
ncbi:3-deoxy-manno-octulosonate cytidylyltransferase [Methylomonas sp. DH-1]|uniref:3-deoxy-manno-octulosonate cytidylyltransferase n=1 Tax=Methylomonas sp. (strain DH-1) TaxID=1727196 RepID=UPI0007C921AA|nr:3-deoxy-manno-octulosonate cytidylyltransferase [Methylomonas sp. DH-1]ANE55861.1 3-deoxy-manno-octulosonate cytidylyltransferase [Methylomonas sp. DH-1]